MLCLLFLEDFRSLLQVIDGDCGAQLLPLVIVHILLLGYDLDVAIIVNCSSLLGHPRILVVTRRHILILIAATATVDLLTSSLVAASSLVLSSVQVVLLMTVPVMIVVIAVIALVVPASIIPQVTLVITVIVIVVVTIVAALAFMMSRRCLLLASLSWLRILALLILTHLVHDRVTSVDLLGAALSEPAAIIEVLFLLAPLLSLTPLANAFLSTFLCLETDFLDGAKGHKLELLVSLFKIEPLTIVILATRPDFAL